MMDLRKTKVLLVDDHAVVRAGFRRLLETSTDVEVVAEAGSGAEAIQYCSKETPDVVVMDLSMPGMGGLDAISSLRRRAPALPILVLSVHENEPFPSRALQRGAKGYLTKRCAPDELITAVSKIAKGGRYLAKDIATTIAFKQINNEPSGVDKLSPREFQVFSSLAQGKSVIAIAEELFLSPKTVHVHKANVLRKLNAASMAELVRLAIRSGVIEP